MTSRYTCNRALRDAVLRGDYPAWLARNPRKDYIVRAVLCTPPWVKRADFEELKRERNLRTAATGVPHVLDHIIPLGHPLVRGLNVPWNVQVIDARANALKSNKLHPAFQYELFTNPEQLRLI